MAALIKIAILNETTLVKPAEVQDWVRVCEIQMNRDYFMGAVKVQVVDLVYVPKGTAIPANAWWIAVVDNADMANALGYHDLTTQGLPMGKVFVKTAKLYGEHPCVTLSHELLEMLGDPFANFLVSDGSNNTKLWAKEVCDPVQELTYNITLPATATKPARTYPVSNFVKSAYWNSVPTKRPYDFLDTLSGPVPELAPGGWALYLDGGIWGELVKMPRGFSLNPLKRKKMRLDSPIDRRRILRLLPKVELIKSTTTKTNGDEPIDYEPKSVPDRPILRKKGR